MDQLEYPKKHEWHSRRFWFEGLFDTEKRVGGFIVSEQALGLLVDLQAAFCAGAYIGVVILAAAVIDSHLKDVEGGLGGMKQTFQLSGFGAELDWLRIRRNSLVHVKDFYNSTISVDAHSSERVQHEVDAKRAIALVARVLFETPAI